jgi:hypothetical protein
MTVIRFKVFVDQKTDAENQSVTEENRAFILQKIISGERRLSDEVAG